MIKNQKILYFLITTICLIFIASVIFLYYEFSNQKTLAISNTPQIESFNTPEKPMINNILNESHNKSNPGNCQDLIDLLQIYNIFLSGKNPNNHKIPNSIAKFFNDDEFTNLNIAFKFNIFQSNLSEIKQQINNLETNQPAQNFLQKLIKIRNKNNKSSKFNFIINHLENQNHEALHDALEQIKDELPESLINLIEKEKIFQKTNKTLSKIAQKLKEKQDVETIKSNI